MQNQYFSVALLEPDDDDYKPAITIDTTLIAPAIVLRVGNLSIHLTRARLAELQTVARIALATGMGPQSCGNHPVPYPGCVECEIANAKVSE